MTEKSFMPVLVEPPILEGITSSLSYAVVRGPQNLVYQPYPAQSYDTSGTTILCNIPSFNTVIDRRALVEMEFVLKITGSGVPVGDVLVNIGAGDSLAPFCMNQMLSVLSVTTNGVTNTVNSQQILPALLTCHDQRTLYAYNSTTPVYPDNYANYSQAVGSTNAPFASYTESTDPDILGRGAFNILGISSNSAATDFTQTVSAGTGNTYTSYLRVKVVEPLFALSPYTFVDTCASQGMYGINNIIINQIFANQQNRVYRTLNSTVTVTLNQVLGATALLVQETPKPSKSLFSRNVVPYYTAINYNKPSASALAAWTPGSAPPTITLQSILLSLAVMPDMLICFARKTLANMTPSDPDVFLPIQSCNITLNNNQGLLASASQSQLYNISKNNGFFGSFQQWSGFAFAKQAVVNTVPTIGTCGGPLILRMGSDVPIQESYLSCGSLGQMQLQVTLTVANNTTNALSAGQCEVVVIAISSGSFILNQGSASQNIGLLDAKTVLDVNDQTAYSTYEIQRQIGGGFFSSLTSGLSSLAKTILPKALPIARQALQNSSNQYASTAGDLLQNLGFGRGSGLSAGGNSGGGVTAGAKKKKNRRLMEEEY